MGFNWGSFFSAGVEELGAVAQAKDASVAAEAKAQAEEFAKKQEAYEDEITKTKRLLREEADSIRGLGITDVGKIRTVMKTYGNVNVIKGIEEDFAKYQMATLEGENDGKFKTMADYIKGRITGAGTAMLSDEAAEQAEDEAAIVGDELNIQKATQRAKAQGVSLEEYLQNQATKMSDRPAFNLEARAARLVEESKMGLFGETLTLEEAKKQILGDKTMGEEAKDLGETGFALAREGGLSAEEIIKLKALQEKADPKLDLSSLLTQENKLLGQLDEKFKIVKNINGVNQLTISDAPGARPAMLKAINELLTKDMNKESKKILLALKEKYEQPVAKKDDDKEKPKLNTAPNDYTSKPRRDVLKSLKNQGFDSFKLNGKTYKIPENI